jgi:hypothetical protein
MKRVFLLIAVPALLVTLGFGQTPAAGSNTDPANVKGCLGGSDGNYTVTEDGSRQIFKITTTSVDLKPHVGHDVKLTGHKASGAVSSGAADNTFTVTELSMISEHCAAAVPATVGAVIPYSQTVIEPTTATPAPAPSAPAVDAAAPAATVSPSAVPPSTPAVEAAAPAATASPSSATVSTPAAGAAAPTATVSPSASAPSTPAVEGAAPAAAVSPSAAPVSTPAAEAAAPAVTVSPSSSIVSTPTEKAAHSARPSTHGRRLSANQAAATSATTVSPTATDAAPASPASETVSPASADAATANPSSETASAPAAATTTPTATHRAGSLSLLISFVVLVIVLGTLAPLLLRWRKRKMLERTGTPNLSFTNEVSKKEASSDRDKPEPRKVA